MAINPFQAILIVLNLGAALWELWKGHGWWAWYWFGAFQINMAVVFCHK